MIDLATELKAEARRLGFCLVGIAPAVEADGFKRYLRWLDAGQHGQMGYLTKNPATRRHPNSLLAQVKSVVMVGMEDKNPSPTPPFEGGESNEIPQETQSYAPCYSSSYASSHFSSSSSQNLVANIVIGNRGKIARYAVGPDYHETIWRKLDSIQTWLKERVPGCRTRGVCDTAPLLERDFARRAGLGWIGKNTMLINKHRGSYIMLGALLTDVELPPDQPHESQHCGTCTRCLDACPTDAFPQPGVLDARKCISYLTIETKGALTELQSAMVGDWLFGCDICQDVCPWNRKSVTDSATVDAREILALDDQDFQKRFAGTTMHRSKRRGLARNAAIVLGTTGDRSALGVLQRALTDDDNGVRQAAAWAIQQIEARCKL